MDAQRQTDFKIKDVQVLEDDNRIETSLRVRDSDRKGIVNKKELIVSERIGSGEEYPLVVDRYYGSIDGVAGDTFSILILVDVSGSMRRDDRLINAKEAIRKLIVEDIEKIRCTCDFYLSTFDNDISPERPINKDNAVDLLKTVRLGNDTDLYRALDEKIAAFKKKPGKKVLILLSDGKDDTKNNPYYRTHERLSAADVFLTTRTLKNKDFLIFPIGLGDKADAPFLRRIVAETPTGEDRYIPSKNASELADIFFSLIRESITDYRVLIYPHEDHSIYRGESRTVYVTWKPSGKQNADYKAGSDQNPVNLDWNKPEKNYFFWLFNFFIGALIVGTLLALLYFGVPRWRQREFRLRFVKRYNAKIGGHQKRDPITTMPFKEGDPVVVKCRTITSLSTWQHIGHCPNYPNCMKFIANPCNGVGAPVVGAPNDKSTFWTQKGIYKPLNWLWFGSLGGLIGWTMFAIVQIFFTESLVAWTYETFTGGGLHNFIMGLEDGDHVWKNVETLIEDILVGIFVGTSLTLTLSIVEERGNGAGISWPRIILRSLMGSIICAFVFFIGFVFLYQFLGIPYLSGILIWLFFGIAIGMILSFKTTIEIKRGIIAGIIASVIAYQVYFLIGYLISNYNELARVIGLIFFGAILGYILAQVLIALEDFRLRQLKPHSGIDYPISKPLKHNKEVVIGTGEVDIRVKWDTTALPGHLRLLYQNFKVIAEPKGETMVNGVIISREEKYELKDGDVIKLGKRSNTEFLFLVTESYEQKKGWSFLQRLLRPSNSQTKPVTEEVET